MADGKQWFKVWVSILTDPSMEDQHNQIIGIWTRLGALVAQHGEKGSITISLSQFRRKMHLYEADDVTMTRIFNALKTINLDINLCNDEVTVTFKKWHKYQVDNSAERVAKWRESVTVQEEKRREENKKRIRIRKEENITTSVSNDKIVFNRSTFKFENLNGKRDIFRDKYPALDIDGEIRKAEAWLMSNPQNVKSNCMRFLNNWFSRAQDRAPRKGSEFI